MRESVDGAKPPRPDTRELDDVRELALVPQGVAAGLLVLLVDPHLELCPFDPPGTRTADPDGWELTRPDQLVDGRDVDGEELGRVGDGEEPADLFA